MVGRNALGDILRGEESMNTSGVLGDQFPMSSLVRVQPDTGGASTFASGLGMANGIAQAADGTLYATNDFGFDIDRVDTNGHVDHGWAKVLSTNGVVVSRDQHYLYVSQTFQPAAVQRITIANPSQVSTFAAAQGADMAAGPDDMTRDAKGNLYLAANRAGQVWRIATDGSICVLASGLPNPSAAVMGPGSVAANLYVGRL